MGEHRRPSLVLLVGAPRSGTTWLQTMLGAHPSVASPQETDLFRRYLEPLTEAWRWQLRGGPGRLGRAGASRACPAVLTPTSSREIAPRLRRPRSLAKARRAAARGRDGRAREEPVAQPVRRRRSPSCTPDAGSCTSCATAATSRRRCSPRPKAGALVGARDAAAARPAPGSATSRCARRYADARCPVPRGAVRGARRPATRRAARRSTSSAGSTLTEDDVRAACYDAYAFDAHGRGRARPELLVGGEFAPRRRGPGRARGLLPQGQVGGWRDDWSTRDRLAFDAVAGDLLVELGYEPDRGWAADPSAARACTGPRPRRGRGRAVRPAGSARQGERLPTGRRADDPRRHRPLAGRALDRAAAPVPPPQPPAEHRVYAALNGIDPALGPSFFYAADLDGQAPREAEPARRGRARAARDPTTCCSSSTATRSRSRRSDADVPRRRAARRGPPRRERSATASRTRASASPPSASGSTIGGDWRRGYKWTASTGDQVTDVGGNLLGILPRRRHPVAAAAAVQPRRPRPAVVRRLRRRRVPPRRRVPRARWPAREHARRAGSAVRAESARRHARAGAGARARRALGALPARRRRHRRASPTPSRPAQRALRRGVRRGSRPTTSSTGGSSP